MPGSRDHGAPRRRRRPLPALATGYGRRRLPLDAPQHHVGPDPLAGPPPQQQPLYPLHADHHEHGAAEPEPRIPSTGAATRVDALRLGERGQKGHGVLLAALVAGYDAEQVVLLVDQGFSAALRAQVLAVEVLQSLLRVVPVVGHGLVHGAAALLRGQLGLEEADLVEVALVLLAETGDFLVQGHLVLGESLDRGVQVLRRFSSRLVLFNRNR